MNDEYVESIKDCFVGFTECQEFYTLLKFLTVFSFDHRDKVLETADLEYF